VGNHWGPHNWQLNPASTIRPCVKQVENVVVEVDMRGFKSIVMLFSSAS
jgi:hypothetical protein